jgi:hypothetical protein
MDGLAVLNRVLFERLRSEWADQIEVVSLGIAGRQ